MDDRWPFDWSPPAPATVPNPDAIEIAGSVLAPAIAEAALAAARGLADMTEAFRGSLGALSALARSIPTEEADRG